jgi:hypothetical protein
MLELWNDGFKKNRIQSAYCCIDFLVLMEYLLSKNQKILGSEGCMKNRRSMLFLLICCSFLVVLISWSGASADTGQPIAVLPEIQYEFKPVPEGTQIHHGFKIQNKGTAPLNIEKIKTG